MHEALKQMVGRYPTETTDDGIHALREVAQSIALLGLARAKFFEHAAFYGGTALRIFHDLDRFSEDLDFTLLRPAPGFRLGRFTDGLSRELLGLGLDIEVSIREKTQDTAIQSAFLKGNTRQYLLDVGVPGEVARLIHATQRFRIKLEIDTDPPSGFSTEVKSLLQPIPFAVRVCSMPDLFAGKMHALLFRRWKHRVKGRDWYDFIWFVGRKIPLNLAHLEQRMRQTGHWRCERDLGREDLDERLLAAIEDLDGERARSEVERFLRHPESVDLWSRDFFRDVASRIAF